ncbi:MAG: hypothetical protein IAA73_01420 [Bacteroidetes bacterium]|uniref:Lipocalin-like domain-containing protein n=1 Tax=Candidatus Gallipaludibacter merdavium TaxID=2840839 RepID=A0A9D9HSD1_9BACT|nr:hypothetical protein [Candidatus Gallipaludibacter merdavium]
MKKSFIYFLCLLAIIAVFTSCDEQKQEQEAKKELIIGNWVTTADNYEELLKFTLGETNQGLVEMMGEIRLAMQLNADGTARTGIFAEFYANYGILQENEYLDMYSSNESTGMPSISLSWKLSEDGNNLITSLYVPSFVQNGQTIPETRMEESYSIDILNENELKLTYINAEDSSLNITLQMVRPTGSIRFITIDEVSGGLSILPKHLNN